MNLAFWRRDNSDPRQGKPVAVDADGADERSDPARALRVQARRRLIGAAALLLAVVVAVPMLLDPAPKPVADSIQIDIPSENTPFSPRLPLAPLPEPVPEVAPTAPGTPAETPANEAPKAALGAVEEAEPKAAGAAPKTASVEPKTAGPAPKAASVEPKTAARPDNSAKAPAADATPPAAGLKPGFSLQVAALGTEKAAREQVDRLKKAGLPAYQERVSTKDGTRFRVRLGPYPSRAEAQNARAALAARGISANLVEP